VELRVPPELDSRAEPRTQAQAPKMRRGSIINLIKGEREHKEVRAATTHARRMSLDHRRMSLSGLHAGLRRQGGQGGA
jgi:hypothetical protein